jgi:hypothetical protein
MYHPVLTFPWTGDIIKCTEITNNRMEVLAMKKTLHKRDKTRAVLVVTAGLLVAGIVLASCGGGGYGGGGGGYGGMGMVLPPKAFSLISPMDGATGESTMPTLTWSASLYATGYYVYLKKDTDPSFMLIKTTTSTSFTIATALTASTPYDWKVTAFNNSGMITAGTFTFTTGP